MSDTTEHHAKKEDAATEPRTHTAETHDEEVGLVSKPGQLHTDLRSRHMQMIAIGGAIGAGLFIGSGSALYKGGPAALVSIPFSLSIMRILWSLLVLTSCFSQVIGYLIVGIMLLFTMQALAELAVLYPVNGAFYTYVVRFVDPSWYAFNMPP